MLIPHELNQVTQRLGPRRQRLIQRHRHRPLLVLVIQCQLSHRSRKITLHRTIKRPIQPLRRDIRRGDDADVGVDQVKRQSTCVPLLRLVLELESRQSVLHCAREHHRASHAAFDGSSALDSWLAIFQAEDLAEPDEVVLFVFDFGQGVNVDDVAEFHGCFFHVVDVDGEEGRGADVFVLVFESDHDLFRFAFGRSVVSLTI